MSQRLLILGCGYLGSRLAEAADHSEFTVDALSRNADTCRALQDLGVDRVLQSDLADTGWHGQVNPADYAAIVLCVGSAQSDQQGYRESYLDGTRSLIAWAQKDFHGKILYTSSISVYGDADSAWVDETTSPLPESWRGAIILESEQLLSRAFPRQSLIFRLGGLYGPGRNRFLRTREQSNPNPFSEHYLNLIHVQDAAEALLHAIRLPNTGHSLYNLTDNHPVKRSELRDYLSTRYPETETESTPTRRHRAPTPNRRVRSALIREDLSWNPVYPNVFDAIPHMV